MCRAAKKEPMPIRSADEENWLALLENVIANEGFVMPVFRKWHGLCALALLYAPAVALLVDSDFAHFAANAFRKLRAADNAHARRGGQAVYGSAWSSVGRG